MILMEKRISRDALDHILDAVDDQEPLELARYFAKMRPNSQMRWNKAAAPRRFRFGSPAPISSGASAPAKTDNKWGNDTMPCSRYRLLGAVLAFSVCVAAHTARGAPAASVEVDARDAPRGIERVHLVLPVKPGKLTLLYPKWLPGDHSPDGPIGGLSGLK